MALVNAAGEPDCAALAEENPLKINRYYHPHESDCNLYYQCSPYALVQMADHGTQLVIDLLKQFTFSINFN